MAVESLQLQLRPMTLSDQLAVPDSSDLRDLLRAHNSSSRRRRRRRSAGGALTLASIIAADKTDIASSSSSSSRARTLHDVLRGDEDGDPGDGGEVRSLRYRRGGAGRTASSGDPGVAAASPSMPPRPVVSTTLEVILAEHPPTAAPEAPARLSLMALLEQAEWSVGGGIRAAAAVEVEEEVVGHSCRCCVCMKRHKGAAFIPCGHTFCRRCSRELWVRRRSCPLCNAAINDILDIY